MIWLAILCSFATIIGSAIFLTFLLWIFYLACMNIVAAKLREEITAVAFLVAAMVVGIFYILDFVVNVYVCSLVFLDFPRESTVTSRLDREYLRGGWRASIAVFVAKHFLNTYDPKGKHCEFPVIK